MAQYTLENGNVLELDFKKGMDGSSFDLLYSSLTRKDGNEIIDISFHFRNDFPMCMKLLDLALSKTDNYADGIKSNTVELYSRNHVRIKMLALQMQHNRDITDLMNELQHINDARINLLKGLALLNKKEYSSAEFLFSSIKYKKGLDIVKLYKKEISNDLTTADPIIKCYFDSSNWKNLEVECRNEDFLFRIGQSSKYKNIENIDVQLTLLDQQISNSSESNKACLLECIEKLRILSEEAPQSAEIIYMIGKSYHLMKQYDRAKNEYKKSLLLDPNYAPSQFNLCRIEMVPFQIESRNPSICDYNALVALKNNIFDINLDFCSDFIRRLGWTIMQVRTLKMTTPGSLEALKEYFNEVPLENNLAIILNDPKIIERLLNKCDYVYKDYLLYNLAIMKKNTKMLKESNLNEAKIQYDYLTNNKNTSDFDLNSFLNRTKNTLSDEMSVVTRIIHGCICIDENDLNGAEKAFLGNNKSMYCINALGIVAGLRGKHSYAIKLFKQILDDYENGYLNLGNVYFLNKEYKMALDCYIKAIERDPKEKHKIYEKIPVDILKYLINIVKDKGMIEKLISFGLEELESSYAIILLSLGEVEAVRSMNLNNEEVLEKLNEFAEREKIRKRKMAQIEEYRKRRNLKE